MAVGGPSTESTVGHGKRTKKHITQISTNNKVIIPSNQHIQNCRCLNHTTKERIGKKEQVSLEINREMRILAAAKKINDFKFFREPSLLIKLISFQKEIMPATIRIGSTVSS